MPDPTTPLDLEAIREWYERFMSARIHSDPENFHLAGQLADELADTTPALLSALAEAQRERDDERAKVEALLLGDKALQPRIWLGEEVQRLKAQLAEAQRREELMRPVVEAAREVVRVAFGDVIPKLKTLEAAVDTYETQEGTE